MLTHPWTECQHPKLGWVEQIDGWSGEVNISVAIRALYTKFWKVPEAHRDIFWPLERCQHTCGQSASTQNWDELSKYMGRVGRSNISGAIRALYTKFFWEVSERHRDISRPLRRCWHTYGQSAGTQNWTELNKYMGEWGCQYLSFH